MTLTKCLTIAGSDSGGGAGIQGDLKTFSALGAYGMSVITALTAQNSLGVQGVEMVPPDFVVLQLASVLDDIGCDAAKTGMLGTAEITTAVARELARRPQFPLVVDPVMVSSTGAVLLSPEAVDAVRNHLLPLATIATPNIAEAEVLSGLAIRNPAEAEKAAKVIAGFGANAVLVKGGDMELEPGKAVDVLFDGRESHSLIADRISHGNTHGSGCCLAAAISVGLGRGMALLDAVNDARAFVRRAIAGAVQVGGGPGPVNHFAGTGSGNH